MKMVISHTPPTSNVNGTADQPSTINRALHASSMTSRFFNADEVEKGDMARYIEARVRCGAVCHAFDYLASYRNLSSVEAFSVAA